MTNSFDDGVTLAAGACDLGPLAMSELATRSWIMDKLGELRLGMPHTRERSDSGTVRYGLGPARRCPDGN